LRLIETKASIIIHMEIAVVFVNLLILPRTDPVVPCSTLLVDLVRKTRFLKAMESRSHLKKTPSIGNVVIWVAKLGCYLSRKSDGTPGRHAPRPGSYQRRSWTKGKAS
jgi:hypothetical protein